MTAVRFERRGDTYTITFAYDPTLIAVIKTVPSFARSWNPTAKQWVVIDAYAPQLADDMARLGYIVVGIETSRRREVEVEDVSCWARLLFKRVGRHRSDHVYRALSKCLHPDVGGDTELQRELNLAHAEISQRKDPAA